MKAYVDPDLCIGCGVCPEMCSEVFLMDDETNLASVKAEVSSELEETAAEARDACPVSAISLEE